MSSNASIAQLREKLAQALSGVSVRGGQQAVREIMGMLDELEKDHVTTQAQSKMNLRDARTSTFASRLETEEGQ